MMHIFFVICDDLACFAGVVVWRIFLVGPWNPVKFDAWSAIINIASYKGAFKTVRTTPFVVELFLIDEILIIVGSECPWHL